MISTTYKKKNRNNYFKKFLCNFYANFLIFEKISEIIPENNPFFNTEIDQTRILISRAIFESS